MWTDSKWFFLENDQHGDEYVRPVGDEVLVVALTANDDVILACEPSPAFGEDVLILPGGSVEVTEAYEVTANRELQEEIGYRAGRLDFIGELRPWAKYLKLTSYLYLARDLVRSKLIGDEPYSIGAQLVPLDRFDELVSSGTLRDSRVVAALYMTRAFLSREANPTA